MMEKKYTPGSWSVGGSMSVGTYIEGRYRWTNVCCLPNDDEDYKDEIPANAHLISAAPDLLEALKELKEWIEDECGAELPSDKADAAIAKAYGRE